MKLTYNNSKKTFNSSTREGAIRNELKGIKGSIEEILDGKTIDSDEFDDFADNVNDSITYILHNLKFINDYHIATKHEDEDEND